MAGALFSALQNLEAVFAPLSGKGAKPEEEIEEDQGGSNALEELGFPEIVTTKPVAGRGGAQGAFDKLIGNNRGGIAAGGKVPSRRLEITTFTSDMEGAGTRAAVFIYLGDGENLEGPIFLTRNQLSKESSNGSSSSQMFSRGAVVTFEIDAQIKELKEIMIGKEPLSRKDKWHLLKVVVKDRFEGKFFYFPCEQWLATTHSAISTEVHLFPRKTDPTEKEERVQYQVMFKTCDVPNATCEANPFIAIYGTLGCTGKMWLEKRRSLFKIISASNSTSQLIRGERATFQFNSFDVGDIVRIQVGHDNRGLGNARWKLAEVVLEKTASERMIRDSGAESAEDSEALKQRYYFTLNGWLGDGNEDGLYEAMLYPNKRHRDGRANATTTVTHRSPIASPQSVQGGVSYGGRPSMVLRNEDSDSDESTAFVAELLAQTEEATSPAKLWHYKIWISTSSANVGSDYDGDAAVQLYGSEAKTGLLELPGPFKGGSTIGFQHEAVPVGKLEQVMLMARLPGDKWMIQDIFVELVDDSGKTNAYMFSACDRWLNGFRQPKSVYLQAYDITQANRETLKIVVYTGLERSAATQDGVYLQLAGTQGKSRMLSLNGGADAFRKGAVSQFYRSTVKLGQLKTALLCIDGKKTGTWRPEQVEVVDTKLNKMYIFPCTDQLQAVRARGGELLWGKKTLRALTVNSAIVGDSELKCRYKVLFHTGDAENASTRSSISFVLYGNLGESGKVIVKGGPSRFNRGQLDAVFLEHTNMGDMYKMRLGLETHKPADWLCTLVEVVNLRTGSQSFFMPNGTLATTTGAERFKDIFAVGKRIPSGVVTYKVIVSTGNAKESNMSSVNTDISIEIQGSLRVISKVLQPEKDVMNFARGSVDVFDLECLSVGNIESAVVMLHPRKRKVKWDLQYVEIIDARALENFAKAGGNVAGDFGSKLFGCSVYLENSSGIIDTKERTKRRIKRTNYPRGFPSLEARLEDAQMQVLGTESGGAEAKSAGPAAPSIPKPGVLSLLRLF